MPIRTILKSGLLILVLAGGCAAVAGGAGSPTTPVAVPLDRERKNITTVGALEFRGALDLPDGAGVGGLSGLWVSPDGQRFVAVSDNGKTAAGQLSHDPAGRLVGAGGFSVKPLVLDDDPSYRGRRDDSEEIARLPDGGWLVSFERNHRILRYAAGRDRPEGKPVRLPVPPGLEDAPRNGGAEALTVLADGRLLAVEEGDDDGTQDRPAWLAKPNPAVRGDWQRLTYRTAPRFRPVGAAALPGGGVLVLERRVSLLGGWASRIVHVAADQLRPGAVVSGVELARLEPPLLVDNFEGIAVRPGRDGETLVYIVSDDNRSPLQRTYLALFALPEAALKQAVAGR